MSFTGNPGTGKTTVAMKMAQVLHRLGYIAEPRVVACTRDDLVGQYVGHTAPKTKEVLRRAYGGVLFIDEAYYLYRPENERDYGQEAIEILLQVMEAERDKLVVIFAGYKDRMDDFFRSNPGLSSRVAHHIDFPDYDVDELMAIAHLMLEQQNYVLRPRCRGGVSRVPRAPGQAPALRARPERPQLDRPRPAAAGEPALRRRRGGAHPRRADDDHPRRHPAEQRVRRGPRAGRRGARRSGAHWRRDGPLDHPRRRRRLRGRQDDADPRPRSGPRRGQRHARLRRRLPPLRPPPARPSATSPRSIPSATTWTSWRSTSRTCGTAEPILKPVYQHKDGTFGPLVRVDPKRFSVVEGLLGYYTEELRRLFDVKIYLAPPEELRRKWKVQRDCSRRGYTTDQVLSELDRREPDSEAYIRPQRAYADIVVSFLPGDGRRSGAPRRRARAPADASPSGLSLGPRRRGATRTAGSRSPSTTGRCTSTSRDGSTGRAPRRSRR